MALNAITFWIDNPGGNKSCRNYVAISANGVTFGRDNLRLISVVYPSNCNCQKAENLKAEDQKLVI